MRHESGFSLLEVLVSMLVISIGVLGMAGIQLLAIKNTEWARYQSQVSMLTSGMVAEMQANYGYWGNPNNQFWTTVAPTITVNGSAVAVNGASVAMGNCLNAACNAQQMANYDLVTWGKAIATALPAGTATINCQNITVYGMAIPDDVNCIVKVNWQVSQPGLFANGITAASNVLSYQTVVDIP